MNFESPCHFLATFFFAFFKKNLLFFFFFYSSPRAKLVCVGFPQQPIIVTVSLSLSLQLTRFLHEQQKKKCWTLVSIAIWKDTFRILFFFFLLLLVEVRVSASQSNFIFRLIFFNCAFVAQFSKVLLFFFLRANKNKWHSHLVVR